ncbi:oligosaccharide flippase family protein [Priestia megaterium]|uniref:oligosaccharide flippase family protein n=1 Tax=Priestia megaterium TaxID=1404 RepID=UPI0030C921FB
MLYRKIFKVIFVDAFTLLSGLIGVFFLPKIMSIDSYSLYKTFTLYITYAGVFHFGFSDGIYIKFGGRRKEEINNAQIKSYYVKLIFFTFAVSIVMLVLSFITGDVLLKYFALYILPFNLIHFYKLLYRALGEFDRYSLLQGMQIILNLIPLIVFIFIPSKAAQNLIIMQVVGIFIAAIIMNIILLIKKAEPTEKYKAKHKEILAICYIGFTVMVANLLTNLFFSIDRWLIKVFFSSKEFAYYSFAISLLSLFSVLIASFTSIAYPYLARANNTENTKINQKLKIYLLIFSFIFINTYYLLANVVEFYVPKYSSSLKYLYILFLSIPFIGVINVIYSNMYKVQKKVKLFLYTVIFMLGIAVLLNIVAIYVFSTVYSISLSTLCSFFIWYLYSSKHFTELSIGFKEIIYVTLNILTFIGLNVIGFNTMLTMFIGLILSVAIAYLFYKIEVNEIGVIIKKIFKRE